MKSNISYLLCSLSLYTGDLASVSLWNVKDRKHHQCTAFKLLYMFFLKHSASRNMQIKYLNILVSSHFFLNFVSLGQYLIFTQQVDLLRQTLHFVRSWWKPWWTILRACSQKHKTHFLSLFSSLNGEILLQRLWFVLSLARKFCLKTYLLYIYISVR